MPNAQCPMPNAQCPMPHAPSWAGMAPHAPCPDTKFFTMMRSQGERILEVLALNYK
ncbi:MAG: hypothetical protein F6J93_17115 [Oscillatoria sp. SIO1A7]|nr:hypothetical protein [Oscillatoria sp. SIO1A7]